MNNNTKIRLHLSKNLFESIAKEVLTEAKKANDGYTVAVKQPKQPKQSKDQAKAPEVQKTDAETKMEAAPVPATSAPATKGTTSTSTLAKDFRQKAQDVVTKPGLSSKEIQGLQKLINTILSKAPGGELATAIDKAQKVLDTASQNVKEMETNVAEKEDKDTLKEYEQHYEIRNGECRRYNDEGEYTVVSMHYCR